MSQSPTSVPHISNSKISKWKKISENEAKKQFRLTNNFGVCKRTGMIKNDGKTNDIQTYQNLDRLVDAMFVNLPEAKQFYKSKIKSQQQENQIPSRIILKNLACTARPETKRELQTQMLRKYSSETVNQVFKDLGHTPNTDELHQGLHMANQLFSEIKNDFDDGSKITPNEYASIRNDVLNRLKSKLVPALEYNLESDVLKKAGISEQLSKVLTGSLNQDGMSSSKNQSKSVLRSAYKTARLVTSHLQDNNLRDADTATDQWLNKRIDSLTEKSNYADSLAIQVSKIDVDKVVDNLPPHLGDHKSGYRHIFTKLKRDVQNDLLLQTSRPTITATSTPHNISSAKASNQDAVSASSAASHANVNNATSQTNDSQDNATIQASGSHAQQNAQHVDQARNQLLSEEDIKNQIYQERGLLDANQNRKKVTTEEYMQIEEEAKRRFAEQ